MALLLAAMLQVVSRALRFATSCIAPVSAIALDQMQRAKPIVPSSSVNYKQVKKDELAVGKDTRSNLKASALLPLARLGAARAPRESVARGGTRPKIHFLSFLWMCRRPPTDTAPSEP